MVLENIKVLRVRFCLFILNWHDFNTPQRRIFSPFSTRKEVIPFLCTDDKYSKNMVLRDRNDKNVLKLRAEKFEFLWLKEIPK